MGLINRITGNRKSYYKSGELLSNTKINIRGNRHGIHEEFYKSGALKLQTQCKDGIQYGETKSFYENGTKYREFNLFNGKYEGEIKEYFRNGNLKFIKNRSNYIFYDEFKKTLLFEGNLDYPFVGGGGSWDIWKSYREDESILYRLDFIDNDWRDKNEVKNKVIKTTFTKSGDINSKDTFCYKYIVGTHVNYSNEFARQRLVSEIITKPSTIGGPPGLSNGFTVNVRQIKSIEDIIKLTPIKSFENN